MHVSAWNILAFAGVLSVAFSSTALAAEAASEAVAEQSVAGTDQQTEHELGFRSSRGVEATLKSTSEAQHQGPMERYKAWKDRLAADSGLTFGFDNFAHYLDTNADGSPSDGATNVTRIYGTWTATGRGTTDTGALVFKGEYRTAIGNRPSTQALGPALGYAGLFATPFSDAGLILTNLYWHQTFADGRGGLVVGQIDPTDYVSVSNLANPWAAFNNLAFEQPPTLAAPSQGLGAAMLWRLNDDWAVLGGFADANADPSDPWDSAQTLFDTGETFKHIALGWSPAWGDRYDQLVQLTLWQVDDRDDANVEGGHGIDLSANLRLGQWRPFLRAAYTKDAGVLLDRAISVGFGYDIAGGKDNLGLGLGWGRAPDNSRDQYTVEAFYYFDVADFLQITPTIQYIVNPANDPSTDDILVYGARLRVYF